MYLSALFYYIPNTMTLEQLSSSIYNNVVSGLPGTTTNTRFTTEQIEDAIINERLAIIKEYSLKNLIPKKDLMLPINCIRTNCESIDRCPCSATDAERLTHFELPQILNDFGNEAVDFIGSTDRSVQFTVYTDYGWKHHKHKRRGGNKPYVWVDTSPNSNNMYDAFIFNAPLVRDISVVAIFKDPRQLLDYDCCNTDEVNNITFIDAEIEKRVTEKYIRYYRQMATANTPNDQTPK